MSKFVSISSDVKNESKAFVPHWDESYKGQKIKEILIRGDWGQAAIVLESGEPIYFFAGGKHGGGFSVMPSYVGGCSFSSPIVDVRARPAIEKENEFVKEETERAVGPSRLVRACLLNLLGRALSPIEFSFLPFRLTLGRDCSDILEGVNPSCAEPPVWRFHLQMLRPLSLDGRNHSGNLNMLP